MPPSTGPSGPGAVLTGSVRTESTAGPSKDPRLAGVERRADLSPGLVLTRRGRLTLSALVGLTAVAIVMAVQTLGTGSASPKPQAQSATGVLSGAGTEQEAPAPMGDPLTTATTPPPDDQTFELLPPKTLVPSSSADPDAPSPSVVNGREQPIAVEVPTAASGELVVVPGSTEPVTGDHVWTYRVEVERGLPFDGAEFAAAVHATLSDPRGWGQDGNVFQQVEGDVDFRLLLASPALTDRLCAPLQTRGRVSCRNGDMVVLNALRWGEGIEDYAGDVASYREYLVNHEVGHRLGRSHAQCRGAGEPAPVMMQQTYGLQSCAPNSWPLPGE